jgi:chemotaxis protein MotB
MEANGLAPDQVTQVRGFADQRLRKPDNSLDASNRRISLIVQYIIVKNNSEEGAKTAAGSGEKMPEEAPAESSTKKE